MVIRRLEPDEWELYKEVRLASLRDAPHAFGATLDEAMERADESWRAGLEKRTQLVAIVGGIAVATVGGIVDPSDGAAELVSMWVAPDWRRCGLGAELVQALVSWAAAEAFPQVRLWVATDNEVAERLYARCGFSRTGEAKPIREGELRLEFEMARRL